eukprot:CFRG4472T1
MTEKTSTAASPKVGTLLFCGQTQWDLIGRKTVPKAVLNRGGSNAGELLLAPTRLQFDAIPADKLFKAVYSGCAAAHAVLLSEDDVAYGIGRNDNGQLGSSLYVSRSHPIVLNIPSKGKVISASCGRTHTLVLLDTGVVYAAGNNLLGQLGIGTKSPVKGQDALAPEVPQFCKVLIDEKVVSISAGADFSVFVGESGTLYCSGSAQYGQTGLGATGETIAKGNKIEFGVSVKPKKVRGFGSGDGEIRLVKCASGLNHSLALDSSGKVYSWGFGGYGRLGHKGPKDEHSPLIIDAFAGPAYQLDGITCGQQTSFAYQRDRKMLFMWGQPKSSGEANMYPKSVYDLQGWPVCKIGSGLGSTIILSENSVISYGLSPCFGELGYGEGPKSSSKPKKMDTVEGLHMCDVAVGASFTFLIAFAQSEEEKAIIQQLDIRNIPAPTSLSIVEKTSSGVKRGRPKGTAAKSSAKKSKA